MAQEDKKLLLVDLCARLPYGVILVAQNGKTTYQTDGNTAAELLVEEGWKPYLRPMSSMTEEEKLLFYQNTLQYNEETGYSEYTYESIDWLNTHHFDYRGLIEKGLALEAPKEIYK